MDVAAHIKPTLRAIFRAMFAAMNVLRIFFAVSAMLGSSLAVAEVSGFESAMKLAEDGQTTDKAMLEAFARVFDSQKCNIEGAATLTGRAASLMRSPDTSLVNEQRLNRQRAIQAFIADHKISPNGADFGEVNRNLLYISAGLLGVKVDQSRLLALAANVQRAREIRLLAIRAVLAQDAVIPEAKPVLIELAKDDWFYIQSLGVGPPNPRRYYIFREEAAKGLSRLGVPFRKVQVPDPASGLNGNAVLFETRIELDEPKK